MAKRRVTVINSRIGRSLDALASFEEYSTEVLPILKKAISEGWTAEQMQSDPKIQAALVARQLSIALKEADPSKALQAIIDIRNRTTGKPAEKKELKIEYEKLSDEELDAKLRSLTDEETESETIN
jgi:hypothetical protein